MATNPSALNATTSSWVNSSCVMTSMTTANDSMETTKNRSRHVNMQFLGHLSFVTGSVGSVANGFVLLALLCARQNRRKNVNIFIINQTVLDLLACLFLILTIVFSRIETTSVPVKWIICLLFETHTVVAVASYSSIVGLVVITVERYVKIVHPVVHRNHYRRWMTFAGVILPWVDGVCCYLIPAWATVALVDGNCLIFLFPTPAMFSGYTLTMFVWHYILPPAFFFFAYYSIKCVMVSLLIKNTCHIICVTDKIKKQLHQHNPRITCTSSRFSSSRTAASLASFVASTASPRSRRPAAVPRRQVTLHMDRRSIRVSRTSSEPWSSLSSVSASVTCLTTSTTVHLLSVLISIFLMSHLICSAHNSVSNMTLYDNNDSSPTFSLLTCNPISFKDKFPI